MSQEQTGAINRRTVFSGQQHERELDEIFTSTWLFVGHESEVSAPGDYVTRKMANDPVILVRALSGEIRVILNSCAHRGTQLCRADVGSTTHFRCMYHGWTYDTEGRLRGVPGLRQWYPPDFNRQDHGLRVARTDVFEGLVFATWDNTAPPLSDYLGDLAWYLHALFGRASSGWEAVGEPLRWVSRTNWKISVENFGMDSLHLGTLHENPTRLGIFGATDQPPIAITSVCSGGHGIEATKLVDPTGSRSFPGYPEELWPEFAKNLSDTAAWYASNNLVCKGNIFPNLSFIDLFHDYTGDPTAPPAVAATMLRLVAPVTAHHSEVSMWILVPRDADQRWKRWSQDSLIRTLGVSGTFEPDDLENTAAITAANAGRIAERWDMQFVAGQHFGTQAEIDGHTLPGEVTVSSMNTETMQRNFYKELNRRLTTDVDTGGRPR